MEENITVSITNCSFVLTDENKTSVAIKDNPDGEFILLAKGQGEDAARIVKEAEKANDNEQTFTQCIVFSSDFHTSKKDSEGFNSDYAYRDWKWFLARSDSGEWKLMTWGY